VRVAGGDNTPKFRHVRFEDLAVHGVVEAVLACFTEGGTQQSRKPRAGALAALVHGIVWILSFLYNAGARHLHQLRNRSMREGVAVPDKQMEAIVEWLQDKIKECRQTLRAATMMNKDHQGTAITNARTSHLMGNSTLATKTVQVKSARRTGLERTMPKIVHALLTDLASFTARVKLAREAGLPTRHIDAQGLQQALIRMTFASFIIPHVRPSIVEGSCVYMWDEPTPPCPKCADPKCKGNIVLVHPTETKACWSSPHHKATTGGKRSRQGGAMLFSIVHPVAVDALREMVLGAHATLYGRTAPNGPQTTPLRRWLFMRWAARARSWLPLSPGDATKLLRAATGERDLNHCDGRPSTISVGQGLQLYPAAVTALQEDLNTLSGSQLPAWAQGSIAKTMGNSVDMWNNYYDSQKCPRDAQVTERVQRAQRQQLLVMASLDHDYTGRDGQLPPLPQDVDLAPEDAIIQQAYKSARAYLEASPRLNCSHAATKKTPSTRQSVQKSRRPSTSSSDEPDEEPTSEVDEGLPCEVCFRTDGDDVMLLCQNLACNKGWHIHCVQPPLPRVPDDDWWCPNCREFGANTAPVEEDSAEDEATDDDDLLPLAKLARPR
jgi:PHD-finger